LLEKEINDAGAAKREGKGGTLRERFEEQRAEMVLQQEQELRMLRIGYIRLARRKSAEGTHLAEEIVIVGEHALDELECKCLVEVVQLQELGAFAITEQAQILENGEYVTCCRAESLSVSIWKSNRLELVGEQ
jgi:hypothetical protein